MWPDDTCLFKTLCEIQPKPSAVQIVLNTIIYIYILDAWKGESIQHFKDNEDLLEKGKNSVDVIFMISYIE